MNEATKIIMALHETDRTALDNGDWRPRFTEDQWPILDRAERYLRDQGLVPDGIDGRTWVSKNMWR